MIISWTAAFGLMLGIVLVMMLLGVPVAFSFLIADVVGVSIFMGGEAGLSQLIRNSSSGLTNFALSPIPLFLIMGELFFQTGLGGRIFSAFDRILGRVPGRLSFVTVGGGTLFATLSGSSIASTALLGTLLVPEMTKRGYKSWLSIGPILGVGGLAVLIPPSALGVLLGSLAQINIGALLIAGIMPGLVLAALYALLILASIWFDPSSAPSYEVDSSTFREKVVLIVKDVLPMGFVVFLVVGMIILGWATPTESAACGVAGVLLLAGLYGCLTKTTVMKSLAGAARVSIMMLMIVMASSTFSKVLAFSGAIGGLVGWVEGMGLDPFIALITMFLIMLILGAFMDQLSIMMITLPIFVPLAAVYNYDLIWFAILMLIALEMSLTMPPMGLLLFVMKGVAPPGTNIQQIWIAALPFMLCAGILVALLIAFPDIALWLPRVAKLH